MIGSFRSPRKRDSGAILANAFARQFSKLAPFAERVRKACAQTQEEKSAVSQVAWAQKRVQHLDGLKEIWEQVCIPNEQRDQLLRYCELFERGDASAPLSLLLYGPPGTGKTTIARTISRTVGCQFKSISLPDLKAKYLGHSAQNVKELWEEARQVAPCVLFLDECEGILPSRGHDESDVLARELVTSFLTEWGDLDRNPRIWVIGATNRREIIDPAALSRFGGFEMLISPPDGKNRLRILHNEISLVGARCEIPSEMESLTQGMSGRDLQQLVRQAATLVAPNPISSESLMQAAGKLRTISNTGTDLRARWESLVLSEEMLSLLKTTCMQLRDSESLERQGFTSPRGILLYGPPGTGKTQIARTMANESGLHFEAATSADLKGLYIGHGANRVKQLFERVRAHTPAVLFIDELDIVAPSRSGNSAHDVIANEIVGQLLQELDGVKISTAQRIFVLGATNHPDLVDRAILDRFPRRIEIALPDQAGRQRLLMNFLGSRQLDFDLREGCSRLAALAQGTSGRSLRSWVERAEQSALERAYRNNNVDKVVLTWDDFQRGIQERADSAAEDLQ